MNKLIQALIQLTNDNRGLLWTEEDKEEFADLIVRECAEICLEANDYKNILRHFGVEE